MDYLQPLIDGEPGGAVEYSQLAELWQKKLWHQMGEKLLELVRVPHFLEGQRLLNLQKGFVKRFAGSLSQFGYATFALSAAKQCATAQEACEFLTEIAASDSVKQEEQAVLLCELEIARTKIRQGMLEEGKAELSQAEDKMNSFMGIIHENVHAQFHIVSAEHDQAVGNASSFFSHAILYLTYTKLDTLSATEQLRLATEVGIAALTGDNVYNFGELMQHPIIGALTEGKVQWLADLLVVFNTGDIKKYDALLPSLLKEQSVVAENQEFLSEKIRVMALMELIFARPPKQRVIDFASIAAACELKVEDVELLLIKALSLGVIKGKMDGVAETVKVDWVQPRVLSADQILELRTQVQNWSKSVQEAAVYIEDNSPELLKYSR